MSALSVTPELKTFYAAVRNLKDGYDMPLFIVENGAASTDELFWKSLDENIGYFPLESPYIYESLLSMVIASQKNKHPLVIDIKADPHPLVISLFNRISREGNIVLAGSGERQKSIIPVSSPIMAVTDRKLLEGGISYPHFYDLFSPGFSLS